MQFETLNWLAIIAASISVFLIGGLWYSPVLFGRAWQKANGFSAEDLRKGNQLLIFGLSLVCAFVMALNLAFFLNDPKTDLVWGLTAGLLAGFGWAFMAVTIIGLFERKPAVLIIIHGGYLVVAFTVMGAILGAWR